ncbi:MAG: metallophosphoesterase [Bacteroidetes bacterium]|nr:metallophosphoesterase [Bacteroidota bacterium]
MKRTLIIGDIHGGLRALEQVLERAAVTPDDILIFLGDYVDGWSESFGVLARIIELSQQQTCICIKGNHDVWLEEWLRSSKEDTKWLVHGGVSTKQSYAAVDTETRLQHLHFLERMKLYETDEQQRLFIHAGFTSMHGPEQEHYTTNFSWDRTLWEMALCMDPRVEKNSLLFPKRLKLFDTIYIGHTPTLYYKKDIPMQACNVWNLDTGAAFTGKLTIMDIDTCQYWQSDPLPALYPGETGRNMN